MANKKDKTPKGPSQKNLLKYRAICSQMSSSQTQRILKYMLQHRKITARTAIDKFNCLRLAARIADLKAMGIGIESTLVYKKNKDGETIHFAEYRLI